MTKTKQAAVIALAFAITAYGGVSLALYEIAIDRQTREIISIISDIPKPALGYSSWTGNKLIYEPVKIMQGQYNETTGEPTYSFSCFYREDVWDWWWPPLPFVPKESDTIYIFRKHAGFDPYYPSLSEGYTASELKKYHDELTWTR